MCLIDREGLIGERGGEMGQYSSQVVWDQEQQVVEPISNNISSKKWSNL